MNVEDLNLFIRTAQTGSLTASARQLDITPATASAALKRLEKQLGAELFIRSTRKLRITAEGERYRIFCEKALTALEEGKASLNQIHNKIAGDIRLSASSDLGRNLLLPWLDEIIDQYPELSIELNIDDSLVDFYKDKIDMVLRYGEPKDSSMVAFPIAKISRLLCASPEYIEKFGEPKELKELEDHNCLLYKIDDSIFDNWIFSDKNNRYEIKVTGNRMSNDADIVHRWTLAGKGIALKSRLDMACDLRCGKAVEILPQYNLPPLSLWLICPNRNQVTPAMLLLRDLLRIKCGAELSRTK